MVDQHIFTRGVNNFTNGKHRRRYSPEQKVVAGKHKPDQTDNKTDRAQRH